MVLIFLDVVFIHSVLSALQPFEPATPCGLRPPIGHAMATDILFIGHLFWFYVPRGEQPIKLIAIGLLSENAREIGCY